MALSIKQNSGKKQFVQHPPLPFRQGLLLQSVRLRAPFRLLTVDCRV